jgi:hypothetical protein
VVAALEPGLKMCHDVVALPSLAAHPTLSVTKSVGRGGSPRTLVRAYAA